MKKLFTFLAILTFGFATLTQAATPAYFASINTPQQQHLTKSGKPDKRYNENKHLKKDGTPDMRYKTSKKAAKKKS